MEQRKTPLLDAIVDYTTDRPVYFKIPGHRYEKGISLRWRQWTGDGIFRFDLTEAEGLDDLHEPEGVIREAQELAAEVFHAKKTYFLVNGTTCGNEAMVLASVKELILQPQSEIDKVRSYLLTHGYVIAGEKMVYEDGKYYPAMRAVHGEMPLWQEVELQYGKYLLEEKHPVLEEYLKDKQKTCRKIQEKLATDGKKAEKITARQKELEDELRLIGQALEVYER